MDQIAVRLLRLKLGLSQRAFADSVGVHTITVSRWETGSLIPDHNSQERLSRIAAQTGMVYSVLAGVSTILALFERGDPETVDHSRRVSVLCEKIGRELHFDSIGDLAIAGYLHDTGKAMVPRAIQDYPGRFGRQERHAMMQHVAPGAALAERIAGSAVAEMVAGHHERLDGHGYPLALAGDKICLGARILAAADEFDARTSKRDYRKSNHDPAAVIEEMSMSPGFDPIVVDALGKAVSAPTLVKLDKRCPRCRDREGIGAPVSEGGAWRLRTAQTDPAAPRRWKSLLSANTLLLANIESVATTT